MTLEKAERNERVRRAFSSGYSPGQIAAAFEISPQRVRQIIDPSAGARRAARRRAARAEDPPPVSTAPARPSDLNQDHGPTAALTPTTSEED